MDTTAKVWRRHLRRDDKPMNLNTPSEILDAAALRFGAALDGHKKGTIQWSMVNESLDFLADAAAFFTAVVDEGAPKGPDGEIMVPRFLAMEFLDSKTSGGDEG